MTETWWRPLARLCQSCSCLIPLRRYRSSPIYEPRLRFFVRLPFQEEGLTSYFYSLSESMRHTSPSAPSARPSVCVQSHAEREGGRSAMAFDTMISLITAPLSPPKPFQLWPDPQEKGRGRRLDLCGISKVRIEFLQAPPPSGLLPLKR